MSSIVKQSLLAVALLSVAMVEAAPVDSSKSASPSTKTSSAKAKSYSSAAAAAEKSLRRGKRNVIVEEIPVIDEDGEEVGNAELVATEEDILREQLSDLSDEQLAMLADIVQSQINIYEPGLDTYEIVQLPEYVTRPSDMYEYDYMPRDRRTVPVVFEPFEDVDDQDVIQQQPTTLDAEEILIVPEEALIEAAEQEEQDEMELSQRIAEIAAILNERASRRVRYI